RTLRSLVGSRGTFGESISELKIFLGGPAGAGKTSLTRFLIDNGWYGLDMDNKGTNRVLELLDAPASHPAFQPRPLVIEGGFLDQAPRFQGLIERLGLTTFWLNGPRDKLIESRLQRRAYWDDVAAITRTNWIGLIEQHRVKVRWDYEIQMWHPDGTRKTFEQVVYEIESCVLDKEHRTAPWQ